MPRRGRPGGRRPGGDGRRRRNERGVGGRGGPGSCSSRPPFSPPFRPAFSRRDWRNRSRLGRRCKGARLLQIAGVSPLGRGRQQPRAACRLLRKDFLEAAIVAALPLGPSTQHRNRPRQSAARRQDQTFIKHGSSLPCALNSGGAVREFNSPGAGRFPEIDVACRFMAPLRSRRGLRRYGRASSEAASPAGIQILTPGGLRRGVPASGVRARFRLKARD